MSGSFLDLHHVCIRSLKVYTMGKMHYLRFGSCFSEITNLTFVSKIIAGKKKNNWCIVEVKMALVEAWKWRDKKLKFLSKFLEKITHFIAFLLISANKMEDSSFPYFSTFTVDYDPIFTAVLIHERSQAPPSECCVGCEELDDSK